jgi:6-phosphogluconate dehydrogenase
VISSWLLDLAAAALASDSSLDQFSGWVADSGEGRWTLQAAIDQGVPAQVLAAALFERFASQGEGDLQNRLLSALRLGFGGHVEKGSET